MMMKTTGVLALLVVLSAAPTPSGEAFAQLGSLKKKLKEAVTGSDRQGKPGKEGPRFGGDVVEITEPVLDAFVRGLETELALEKAFRDELAKYPTPEQYAACRRQASTSEEVQKLSQNIAIPENASPEAVKQIMDKVLAQTADLVKQKCPLDPNEWTSSRKLERLKEIEVKAAAATGSPAPGGDAPEAPSSLGGPWEVAESLRIDPLTVLAYQIIKERLVAFCMSALASPGTDFSVVRAQTGQYVYTSLEAQLLQRRCLGLKTKLQQLNVSYDPGAFPLHL